MTPILRGAHFDQLFRATVLLSARARHYRVDGFAGPLSIKSMVRGEAVWRVGGVPYRIDGTACLVVDHREPYDLHIESGDAVETFVVFFADRFASDVAAARLRSIESLLDEPVARAGDGLSVARRLWTDDSPLLGALARVRSAADADAAEVDVLLRGIGDHFADLLVQVRAERERIAAAKASTRAELHRRVLRGRTAIDATLAEPFDLDRAAAEAFLSPHHFHRTFSAAFGEPPYAYVERRRLARARRLLEETEAPVAQICDAVGYASVPSFTTKFRRGTGLPPAAYRRQFGKGR